MLMGILLQLIREVREMFLKSSGDLYIVITVTCCNLSPADMTCAAVIRKVTEQGEDINDKNSCSRRGTVTVITGALLME